MYTYNSNFLQKKYYEGLSECLPPEAEDDITKFTNSRKNDKVPPDAHIGYVTECMNNPKCKDGYILVKKEKTGRSICSPWQKQAFCKRPWDSVMTEDRTIKCCTLGEGSLAGVEYCRPGWCAGSDKCANFMTGYCKNENNFFKDECQSFLKDLNSGLRDSIAQSVCPKYKNSTDTSKKLFCACYNAKIPEEWANKPEFAPLRGAALCVDTDCNKPDALKPFVMPQCDLNYVLCQNKDISAKLQDKGLIGKLEVNNQCGITTNDSTSSSSTPNTGSTITEKEKEKEKEKDKTTGQWYDWFLIINSGLPNWGWVLIGFFGLIVLLLILSLLFRKKRRTQYPQQYPQYRQF